MISELKIEKFILGYLLSIKYPPCSKFGHPMKKYGINFEGVTFQMSAKRLGRRLETSRLRGRVVFSAILTNFQKFCTCPVMLGLC